MSRYIDFVTGISPKKQKKKQKRWTLCYAYPKIEELGIESVLQKTRVTPRKIINTNKIIEDGLYVSSDGPLTQKVIKPYKLDHQRTIDMQTISQSSSKLLEIAVREVVIHHTNSQKPVEVTSVLVYFKEKIVCKISSPFNRKLYKLLVNNCIEANNLSIRVQTKDGNSSSFLPFPLPIRCVREKKLQVDFSISDNSGKMNSGTVICTVSLSIQGEDRNSEPLAYIYKSTNDPNDPQSCLSLIKAKRDLKKNSVKYFLLEDPALCLDSSKIEEFEVKKKEEIYPDIVILEQPTFSLWDISIGSWLRARRPLRPSSGLNALKVRGARDEVLTITILRGVEVPIREESAIVQPLVQIQWGEIINSTTAAEGTSPVWQQTVYFGIPKKGKESGIKFSLYDQHPVWGLQWLGEALIPLEFDENQQDMERWIGLSTLSSPVLRFGYIQAGPIRAYTRIYILMKMERFTHGESSDTNSLNVLSRALQRCLAVPYKISGTESPEDAGKLAMLLTPLPAKYGPLTPRQALKLNKVDHYGRAALLVTLLQGLGVEAFVIIGSSQARKWAAYVLTVGEKTAAKLWDPENGDQYALGDSKCSLIKVTRMINHQNIWKNLQKTAIPSNLRFNTKMSKDWQPLGNNSSSSAFREPQILEVEGHFREIEHGKEQHLDIENQLKDKLSQWRSGMGFTTVFNRHAMSVLRTFLAKLSIRNDGQHDKKDLKQLYRAYQMHGFVLNLRCTPMDELIDLFFSTRIQEVTGAVEFALVCHLQRFIAKTSSLWLAVVVLRTRD